MARILLILPDADQRRALDRIVTENGHETCLATGAIEARSLLAAETFDLVMLDPDLPDEDGFSFLRELRRSTRNQRTVVLNRKCTAETTIKAFGLGATGILAMPFTRNEFFSTIDEAIAA